MQPYELTDDVVRLSIPTSADAESIVELCQEPEIGRWTPIPIPYGPPEAAAFLGGIVEGGWRSGTELTWGLREGDGTRLLGMVGLSQVPAAPEVGFWLGRASRGRGLMTRAVRLVVEAAFVRHELDQVGWTAIAGNQASMRVARRLRFRWEPGGSTVLQRGVVRPGWRATLRRGDPMQPGAPWPVATDAAADGPGGGVTGSSG